MASFIETGAVIFVRDLPRMISFYSRVFGLHEVRVAEDYALLERGAHQLVVHKIPQHLVGDPSASSKPVVREDCVVKLVFFVDSITEAREAANRHGGSLHGAQRVWEFDGTWICDGCDPEGNVFQIRQYRHDAPP